MADKVEFDREGLNELIVGVGSHGMAAMLLIEYFVRALRAKGVLADAEVLAIFDAAAESADRQRLGSNEPLARSIAASIRELQVLLLGARRSN